MMKILWTLLLCIFIARVSCNNLTPDNEDYSDMQPFLELLESRSGLDSLNPSYVIATNCEGFTQCKVNSNGTVLWDVRSILYSEHMMQAYENDEEKQKITMDGCLKYSTDVTEYTECMRSVRFQMYLSIILDFDSKFRSLVQANNCSLVSKNCIID